jgi:hypothetical protein
MPETMTLPEKVIDYIGFSDAAMEKAAEFHRQVATKQAEVEKLIPAAVDALVAHERITPAEREKAAAMLKDPAQALTLLTKMAGHRSAQELGTLGSPTGGSGQKTAGANGKSYNPADSLTNPNVGARTTRIKQSDVALFRGLGIDPPTE